MINEVLKVIEDSKRYFEKCGMYDYIIKDIEVKTPYCVIMTIIEKTPVGKAGEPFKLEFANGNGSLRIRLAITQEDVYDYAEERGWDEETVRYMKYGKKPQPVKKIYVG